MLLVKSRVSDGNRLLEFGKIAAAYLPFTDKFQESTFCLVIGDWHLRANLQNRHFARNHSLLLGGIEKMFYRRLQI